MDDLVPKALGRGPAWQKEKQAAPVITWVGQTPARAVRTLDVTTSVRLHFLIVDHLTGIGFVVAGWLADPLSEVAAISIDTAMNEKLDLFNEAALLSGRNQIQGFGAPQGIAVKFGFVLLVPERSLGKANGLPVGLHLVTGGTYDRVVPPVGDTLSLSDILAAAPLDFALRIIARLLTALRSGEDRSQRLPERLEALARILHQRIDPRHDYGAHFGHPDAHCHVEAAVRVGSIGILVSGWLVPGHADTTKEIALVSLSSRRVVLDTPLPTRSTPDLPECDIGSPAPIDCGFAVFAPIERLDRRDTFWFVEVIMASGVIKRVPFVCLAEPAPLRGIEAAVMLADANADNLPDLFERAISPAVDWFWAQTRCPRLKPAEVVYGTAPPEARVSVIVPVYGRLDFVRHQIARFSNDPDFRAEGGTVDLIYVLDDPAKADEFARLCRFLHDVYGVPFRTLVQSQNLGYSAANNAGAGIARGRLLLLLNSDVFPDKPRWVGHLASTYDTLDGCGILGCRLLFEDGSLQHAGMRFRASNVVRGCWENVHPGQGLPPSFDSHTSAEPVQAVTGACLMIQRVLFDELGGMSEDYVIGDFEDSDLCLRAQARGLKVYYTPDVELYHLERQSMRLAGHDNLRFHLSLTLYNEWKHGQRWKAMIPKIMASFDPAERHEEDHRPVRAQKRRRRNRD